MNKLLNFSPYYIGLLAGGLLMLSGCSQEENGFSPSSSRAISFRAQGGQDGLKATTTPSDYISSFVVNAHASSAANWDTYLLKGTTVYRGEGGGNNWAYAPAAYFPENDADGAYVEFFAYSPSGSGNVSSKLADADDELQEITYSVPAPSLTDTKGNTTQEDLLVSYGRVLKADYANPVQLKFRHALSRVLVAAINNTASDVTITGLKLKNLKPSGTLKLKGNTAASPAKSDGIPWSASAVEATNPTSWVYSPTPPTATTDYVTLWDASGTLTDYPYILPGSGVAVSTTESALVTSVEQGMYVLPQTCEGNGIDGWETGEFGLEVAYTRDGLVQPPKTVAFKDINNVTPAAEVTFEIGRQYVLHIEIDGTGIKFGSIEVDDYNDPAIDVQKPTVKDYVEVAGIKWALANLDAPGTFASSPTAYGMHYQYGRGTIGWSNADPLTSSPAGNSWDSSLPVDADWDMTLQNPCPSGWRVPAKADFDALMGATNQSWHNDYNSSGIKGRSFSDATVDADVLFLPLAGIRAADDGNMNSRGNNGGYWTRSRRETSKGWSVWVPATDSPLMYFDYTGPTGFSVRCVRTEE